MSSSNRSTPPMLVAYDRQAVYTLLREQTTLGLRALLSTGTLTQQLEPAQIDELDAHLEAWVQRALGPLHLRDALLVDGQRGRRVFSLLCAAQRSEQAPIPTNLISRLPVLPSSLEQIPPSLATAPALVALAARAQRSKLALAILDEAENHPFPDDLEALTPPLPLPAPPTAEPFEQPVGWRRRGALLLTLSGALLLLQPLLQGSIPNHPAGLPLALLTLALLVGIRAGWAGYTGSLCIWLVANLPSFRHGSSLPSSLWPALPLIIVGLLLLWYDPRVRAMWAWIRQQLRLRV